MPAMLMNQIANEIGELVKRAYELAERVDISPQDVACMQFEIMIMLSILMERLVEDRSRG